MSATVEPPADDPFAGTRMTLGEHLDESKLPALVQATKRAGVWNVPTQVLMENLVLVGSAELAQRPEMRYVAPQTRAQWTEVRESMLS